MERKQQRLVVKETEEQMRRVFLTYRTPLTSVPLFNYSGRTLSSSNNNWPAVEQNLHKARGNGDDWQIFWEGRNVEVVQAVLIFGSDMWLLTPWLEKYPEGFHHRAVQRMASMGPKFQQGETFVYTPIGVVLAMVRLEEIGAYNARRQNMVAQ